MDSEVREKVAAWKKENEERREERLEELEEEKKEEFRASDDFDDDSSSSHDNGYRDTRVSSGESSDTGCLPTLFSLVFFLIAGLFKCIFYFYKFMLLHFMIPLYASVTIYSLVVILLCAVLGFVPGSILFSCCSAAVWIISIPYWVVLFIHKRKIKMTWKKTFKYYGKWFLKGPVAYADLANLLNETNTMPKVANLLGIIIGWFKKK